MIVLDLFLDVSFEKRPRTFVVPEKTRLAMAIRMEISTVNTKVLGLFSNETSKMSPRTIIHDSDFHPDDYLELVMVICMEIGDYDFYSNVPPPQPSMILFPILLYKE